MSRAYWLVLQVAAAAVGVWMGLWLFRTVTG